MGGDTTFFGSGAETTNLYLQHVKKNKKGRKKRNKSLSMSLQKENKLDNTIQNKTTQHMGKIQEKGKKCSNCE